MGETWSTVDPRVTKQSAAAGIGGNKVPIQAPGNPNAGTIGGTTRRRVHCWTGDPTWRRHLSREKDKSAATGHAGSDEVQEIPYIHALTSFLLRAETPGPALDFLDFHTHGGSGFVAFEKPAFESKVVDGKDTLVNSNEEGIGWMNLGRLDNHDAAFNRGASIEFHGCNVADAFEGEVFLYEACARLLPKGGKIGASTGLGFSWGWKRLEKRAEKGDTFHPFGEWVTWEAKPENAAANMVGTNLSYFHKIPEVIAESRKMLEKVVMQRASTRLPDKVGGQKPDAPKPSVKFDQFVASARRLLKLDAPSEVPSRLEICWGRAYIRAADAVLELGLGPKYVNRADPLDPAYRWARATQDRDDMAIAVLYAMNEDAAPAADGLTEPSDRAFADNESNSTNTDGPFGMPASSAFSRTSSAGGFGADSGQATADEPGDEEPDEVLAEAEPEEDEELLAETEPEEDEELLAEAEPEEDEELLAETEPEEDEELLAEAEPEEDEELLAETEPEEDEELLAEAEPEEDEELLAETEPEEDETVVG